MVKHDAVCPDTFLYTSNHDLSHFGHTPASLIFRRLHVFKDHANFQETFPDLYRRKKPGNGICCPLSRSSRAIEVLGC